MNKKIILPINIVIATFSFILLGCNIDKDNKIHQPNNKNTINYNHLNRLYSHADSILYQNPDSTRKIITSCLLTKTDDSLFIGNCYKLLGATYNLTSCFDSAIYYNNKALEIGKEIKDTNLMARSIHNIGMYNAKMGKYNEAINQEKYAISLYKSQGNKSDYSNALIIIGSCFEFLGKLDSALHYAQLSLDIKEKYDLDYKAKSYLNIANLYVRYKEYKNAEKFYLKAIEIESEKHLKSDLCYSYSSISSIYIYQNNISKALKYLELSKNLSLELNEKYILSNTYCSMGEAWSIKGNYPKSMMYSEKALKISREIGIKYVEALALLNIGNLYHYKKEEDKADKYIDSAYTIGQDLSDLNFIGTLYHDHSNLYKERDDFVKAYFCLNKYNEIKDSINKNENLKAIEELNIEYETKKKDLEIRKNIMDLKTQRITIYSILTISFLLIIGFVIAYRMQLQKINTNIELYKRNQELAKLKTENKILAKRNSLSDKQTHDIIEKLNQILEDKKIYRSPDLTITKLAEILDTNREYLSQIFNQTLGMKFSDYINNLRIEEAKIILEQESKKKSNHLTMLAIANEVGFKNTSTFNPTFKKFTGLTPSEYKVAGERI